MKSHTYLRQFLAGGLIVLAGLIVYSNSFSGAFVFDDQQAVTINPSIHHLWPMGEVLSPPNNLTVGGRPLFNLTFAINYAISGMNVWSYHVFNLLVHMLAGLTLFGVIRRTLLSPALRDRFGSEALPLALAATVLWMVHPLQTESVAYISQRAESLMGLCYLLTLYCFIRAIEPQSKKALWSVLCVTACLLGMAIKEVMITAPLMVLLYDRTFVAGTFREAWRKRWGLYVSLACTWLLFGYLLRDIRDHPVGPGFGAPVWNYLLTECRAIVHYLVLIIWPHPLLFDYGQTLVSSPMDVLPQAIIVLSLLIMTGVAFVRWPRLGFAGVWFFLILAPTSSFIPIVLSPTAEHRLYLPLAALILLLVLGLHVLLGKKSRYIFLALAIVWGTLAYLRNEDYHTTLTLWKDTVSKRPNDPRPHNNYGVALIEAGQIQDGIDQFQEAIQIDPNYADPHNNLGYVFMQMGQYPSAIAQFQESIRINPVNAEAQNNWGNVLLQTGSISEAIGHFAEALRLNPDFAEAHYNLGISLAQLGHPNEAIAQFQETLRVNPAYVNAQNNWGVNLLTLGRIDEAISHFQEALRIKPDDADAYNCWGNALVQAGRFSDALAQYHEALRCDANFGEAYDNLGVAWLKLGRTDEARGEFNEALSLNPQDTVARANLAQMEGHPASDSKK